MWINCKRSANLSITHNFFGGIWQYNEIVGFIKLYILGTQIRGEYFEVDAKKVVKTRKKRFKFITHKLASEKELPLTENNENIYQIILSYLEDCKKKLPKRIIDTTIFERIGPFLDWKKLIQDSPEEPVYKDGRIKEL